VEDEDLAGQHAKLQVKVVPDQSQRLRDAHRQLDEVAGRNRATDTVNFAPQCFVLQVAHTELH
jgi:hypothetical protein